MTTTYKQIKLSTSWVRDLTSCHATEEECLLQNVSCGGSTGTHIQMAGGRHSSLTEKGVDGRLEVRTAVVVW